MSQCRLVVETTKGTEDWCFEAAVRTSKNSALSSGCSPDLHHNIETFHCSGADRVLAKKGGRGGVEEFFTEEIPVSGVKLWR